MVLPSQEVGVESEATDGETNRVSEFVVERICKELEAEGYTIQPLVILACGFGESHKRDRVWFLAHRTDSRTEVVQQAGTDRILPTVSTSQLSSLFVAEMMGFPPNWTLLPFLVGAENQ